MADPHEPIDENETEISIKKVITIISEDKNITSQVNLIFFTLVGYLYFIAQKLFLLACSTGLLLFKTM